MKKYEVSFIYTDYGEDEEPELCGITVLANNEVEAKKKVESRFTPIYVTEIIG